jgi:hypothetical protein
MSAPSDNPSSFPLGHAHRLSDHQLLAAFESACSSSGVSHWVSSTSYFDVSANDLRNDLHSLCTRVPLEHYSTACKAPLQHALRILAWHYESLCLFAPELDRNPTAQLHKLLKDEPNRPSLGVFDFPANP